MKILSRRAGFGCEQGTLQWIAGFESGCAEMSVEDEGIVKWISVSWQSLNPEILQVCVTDRSLYRFFSGLVERDDEGNIIPADEKDFDEGDRYCIDCLADYDGPYLELVGELIEMLGSVVEINESSFKTQDDVWPWLADAGIEYNLPEEDVDEEYYDEDEEEP